MTSDRIEIELAGKTLSVSNPDKVFFKKRGETKLDLIEYYRSVEGPILLAMGGRPTLLQRFPDGAGGKNFFQKRVPKGAPDWLQTATVSTVNGTTSNAMVVADIAHIGWAVQMGVLGFHPWPYLDNPDIADELRIDLDPHGVDFDAVREGARLTRDLLDELGIASGVKTSGSKGLHIFVRLLPQWDSYQVRSAAVALARELERRHPELLTWAWWKEERGDRVFVDYNQNCPHKTMFGAWSVRARVGAQVSTPLFWDELATVDPNALTMETVPDRLAKRGDPWAELYTTPQTLEPLLAMSARDMDAGMQDAPWPPVYPKQPNEPPRVAPSRARKA